MSRSKNSTTRPTTSQNNGDMSRKDDENVVHDGEQRPIVNDGVNNNNNNNNKRRRYSRKRKMPPISPEEWNAFFVRLAIWKHNHNGDMLITPSDNKEGGDDADTDDDDADLASWAHYQRSKQGRAALTDDQRAALDGLGFTWNIRGERDERRWQERYQQLVQYKEQHGDTNVPTKKKHHELSSWVAHQRTAYAFKTGSKTRNWRTSPKWKKNPPSISDGHVQQLNEIGFVWNCKPMIGWDVRCEELKQFKASHGHTRVPQHWVENKQLGKWVAKNRAEYNLLLQLQQQQGRGGEEEEEDNNKKRSIGLTQERIDRLNELDFDWGKCRPNARKSKTNSRIMGRS